MDDSGWWRFLSHTFFIFLLYNILKWFVKNFSFPQHFTKEKNFTFLFCHKLLTILSAICLEIQEICQRKVRGKEKILLKPIFWFFSLLLFCEGYGWKIAVLNFWISKKNCLRVTFWYIGNRKWKVIAWIVVGRRGKINMK